MKKNYTKILTSLCGVLLCISTIAQQNVGVGTTTPDVSAIMDMVATDKGVLVPRTDTNTVYASFATPATGLLIYQTTDDTFYYFNGTQWLPMGKTTQGPPGQDGADGADGQDGIDGIDGNTILNGVVDPTTEGKDGDFYINTATDSIFGPKVAGTWPTPGTPMRGQDGVDGLDGVPGDKGDQGDPGPVGCATANMVIKSNGTTAVCSQIFDDATNVGIGTTTPGAKLDVVGTGGSTVDFRVNGRMRSNNDNGGLWVASDRFFGGHTTDKAGIYNNGAWRLTVQSDGNVGIGTNSPSYHLHVVGRLKTDGIDETSDKRFKKNIASLENPLELIAKIRGVKYEWRQDEFPQRKWEDGFQIGVIAQEVEAVIPEVVSTDNEGYKAVNYSHLVPVLIEAIKELKLQVENSTTQINELKAENGSQTLLIKQLLDEKTENSILESQMKK